MGGLLEWLQNMTSEAESPHLWAWLTWLESWCDARTEEAEWCLRWACHRCVPCTVGDWDVDLVDAKTQAVILHAALPEACFDEDATFDFHAVPPPPRSADAGAAGQETDDDREDESKAQGGNNSGSAAAGPDDDKHKELAQLALQAIVRETILLVRCTGDDGVAELVAEWRGV